MSTQSVLNDIKDDLDGMPRELLDDLKKLVEDASPAIGSTMSDARARGAALGATLVSALPDQVMDRVPDAVADRLPTKSSKGSTFKKVLLIGGATALAAAAAAALKRRSAATTTVTAGPAHATNGQVAPGATYNSAPRAQS